jgi:hypothetical protein
VLLCAIIRSRALAIVDETSSMNPHAAPLTSMLVKSLLTLAAFSVLACSGGVKPQSGGSAGVSNSAGGALGGSGGVGTGGISGETGAGDAGADSLIVPTGLDVLAEPGANSVFDVIALTLSNGPNGAELYAAVRNDGNTVACNASFRVQLLDKDQQTVGAGISGLLMQHFYQLTDGSGTIASCAAPGDLTMVVVTDLSLGGAIEDVRQVIYSSNYWDLDVVIIDGISITGVKAVTSGAGVAYTGVLTNGLGMPLSNPSVAVFPLNAVGRPLGLASGSGTVDVPAGGNWDFETDTVSDPGVGFAAFPGGGS